MEPDFQDSLVTSSEDVIQIENGAVSERKLRLSDIRSACKKKNKEVNDRFPWLRSFQKLSRSLIGNASIKVLLNLITIYTEQVSGDVTASYSRPNRAAKVKQSMINVITLFHSCYTNINAPLDEGIYMEKMSNLLTMYMDMEIKASRRGKESVQRIASKIISTLFIVLNNSPEYILDTILNARFITVKNFSEICIPIFKKVTSDLQPHQDITYVRCLLIFKLWKRLVARGGERNSLNRLAVARLSPPPPQLLEMIQRGLMIKVLPLLPPNKKPALVTRFYLLAKFNLRNSIKALMKLKTDLNMNDLATALDSSTFFEDPFSQENLLVSEDLVNPKLNLEDCSFLDSSQDNYSECAMSDSASPDVILCDDSPKKSKKNKISKSEKISKKKENVLPRKNKENKATKKQGATFKNKTKLSSSNDSSFSDIPILDFKKIKLNSYHISEEQNSNKALPSSTVNDESVSVNQGNLIPNEVLQLNHNTQSKEICKALSESSNSENSKSNFNCIKKESEEKTLFSCQQSCRNDSQEKQKQTLDSNYLITFPKLLVQNQEGSDVDGNIYKETILGIVSTDNDSKNDEVKIKYESKHEAERNTCGVVTCQKDSGVQKFNSDTIVTNNVKLFEPITQEKETKTTSDSSEKNKLTQAFENEDNNVKINHTLTIICNGPKDTVDHFKTNLDREISSKTPNEALGQISCNLKPQPVSHNTTNLYDHVTSNDSPITIEEPKDATRGFSVLSYIPKSVCETPTLKTTQLVKNCQLKSVVTPQANIKSENEISDCNSKIHKLSVKKEFNCKKDVDNLITASKFNNCQDNEQSQSQNCISNTISTNKVCDQDSCFKQSSKNDINACLLHNILGEEDCLKNCSNECLLKKTTSNRIIPIENSQNCTMKDILGSSEQEYVSIAGWSESSTTIKKELEIESKSLNSIFYENKLLQELNPGGSNSSDEFLKNNLEKCVNALDYQLDHVSENIDIDCDYESGDSNLVIDEDIDLFKEQIEDVLEDQSLNINCMSDSINSISRLDPKNNVKDSKPTKELFDSEKVNKASVDQKCNFLTMNKDISRCSKNEIQNKPAMLPSTFTKEHFQDSAKYKVGNIVQRGSLQCESSQIVLKSCVNEQQFSLLKVKQNTSVICPQVKQSQNQIDSTSRMSQEKISTRHSASPKLVQLNNPSFVSKIKDTSFNQQKEIDLKKHDSFISVKEVPPHINKTQITRGLHKSLEAEKFTQCNSGTILLNSKGQVGPLHQVNSGINKYQNLSTKSGTHEKVNVCLSTNETPSLRLVSGELPSTGSFVQNVQSESVNYVNDKLTDSRNYCNKSKPMEIGTMKSSDVFNKNEVVIPASELTDFEFNVFPVAHEVEVYSATEAILGDFVCTGSSEIGHPDWPIANEQNVIDSSNLVSYSSTPDQYLYTPNTSNEQCYALSEMNQNSSVNSLELQQVSVDFRYPDNIASYPNNDEYNLHFKTLEVDYNLCCSQRKFKEFYLSQDIPPTIPVPFPPQGRLDNMKSSVRCTCEQCSDNHQKLLSNYNILTQFRNSKVRPLNIYSKSLDSSLSDQNCESDCSLPLKKRKTLTNSKSADESARLDGELLSYPNTPMISIAQLELTSFEQQNQIVTTNQSHWNDVPAFTATAHNPLNLANYSAGKQTDLARQAKTSKSRSSKRRKSSR